MNPAERDILNAVHDVFERIAQAPSPSDAAELQNVIRKAAKGLPGVQYPSGARMGTLPTQARPVWKEPELLADGKGFTSLYLDPFVMDGCCGCGCGSGCASGGWALMNGDKTWIEVKANVISHIGPGPVDDTIIVAGVQIELDANRHVISVTGVPPC